MFTRRDYIVRYLELLGDYLRRRAQGQRDDELDQEISEALGMRLEELEDMPESWLETRLSSANEVDAWRALLASELALSVGWVRLAEGRPLAAAYLFERAATCLDWAMTGDLSAVSSRLAGHIDSLSSALRSTESDETSRVIVMRRAEELGRYGVVEDLLFDLADGGWPETPTWAEGFYGRMAALDDDRLRAGGIERGDLDSDLHDVGKRWEASTRF